jgi:hypothetical protein
MINANSIAPHEEVKDEQNPLNRKFDRVSAAGLTPDAAAHTLNRLHRALQGISAITNLLIANGVMEDCCEPALNGFLAGGLLVAANALSDYAETDVEDLAEWAEKRAGAREVCHD